MITFILQGLEFAGLSAFAFYILFTFKRRKLLDILTFPITVLGILFLFHAILSFSYAVGTVPVEALDISMVHTSILVCLTLLMAFIIYKLTSHYDIVFLSGVYVIALAVVAVIFSNPLQNAQFISYFYLAMLFLHLELVSQKDISRAGQFGMLFAGPAALLSFVGWMEHSIPAVIVTLALFGFLYKLYHGLLASHATVVTEPVRKPSVMRVARLIGFTVTFYLFVALAVIGLHEMGHVGVATYYKCEYSKAVIYDVRGIPPHAEISCSRSYNDTLLTLGGVIATSVIGLLLLLVPGSRMAYALSFFVMGFGILVGFSDYTYLNMGKGFLALLHLVGLTFVVLSVVEMVTLFRSEKETSFSLQWEKDK